jgi:hypothetical protein
MRVIGAPSFHCESSRAGGVGWFGQADCGQCESCGGGYDPVPGLAGSSRREEVLYRSRAARRIKQVTALTYCFMVKALSTVEAF